MSGLLAWLAVAIVGTAALTVAMRREHKRLDREVALRRLLNTDGMVQLAVAIRRAGEELARIGPSFANFAAAARRATNRSAP